MEDTHIQLREYIERVLEEREKSLVLTAKNLEHRLDHLNALREDVIRDRSLFLTKDVYDQVHKALVERVAKLEMYQQRLVGVGIVLVFISGILGAVISHLIK